MQETSGRNGAINQLTNQLPSTLHPIVSTAVHVGCVLSFGVPMLGGNRILCLHGMSGVVISQPVVIQTVAVK